MLSYNQDLIRTPLEDKMTTATSGIRVLAPTSQRIAPEKFAHVVLRTANYDEVIAWYATVLQARVAFRNDFIAFLTYDDEHHRVAVLNAPESPPSDPTAAGVHHLAYTYAGLGELLSTYRRLKAGGIEPARCINHGPTTSMYYRDPDGLRVELQIDNFTMDEANAYLTGPDFAENPIGVIFDPEQLIRDYEAGAAFDDLVRRPPLPPGTTPMDMRAERPRA
jgi:catechol 2,3-dioxygenase-like lactoylglutathione lyase family enzyme